MDVNGITSTNAVKETSKYTRDYDYTGKHSAKETTSDNYEVAATYEKSSDTPATGKTNQALVAQMKADLEARTSQLRSLVEDMLSKQGNTFAIANYGNDEDSIWKFLASGDYTVDEAARVKAEEEISENGYWGVKQTSERILSFAKALTGGDSSKIEEMRGAFEKGFAAATKSWGKDLPDISNKTYDAVMKGFDAWAEEAGVVEPKA